MRKVIICLMVIFLAVVLVGCVGSFTKTPYIMSNSISGQITYEYSQGSVEDLTVLLLTVSPEEFTTVGELENVASVSQNNPSSNGVYQFQNVAPGTYYVVAYYDENNDGKINAELDSEGNVTPIEPVGAYTGNSTEGGVITPVILGEDGIVGIDFTIGFYEEADPGSDVTPNSINGNIDYQYSTGSVMDLKVYLLTQNPEEFTTVGEIEGMIPSYETSPSQDGSYQFDSVEAGTYYLIAYYDENSDGKLNAEIDSEGGARPTEPAGVYISDAGNIDPVVLEQDQGISNINIYVGVEEYTEEPIVIENIRGIVEYGDGVSLSYPEILVLLDSTGDYSDSNVVDQVSAGDDGSYSVSGLSSGNYYIFAFDDLNQNRSYDQDEPGAYYVNEYANPNLIPVEEGITVESVDVFIDNGGQENTGIYGEVMGASNEENISGATVNIYDSNGPVSTTTTDDYSNFEFADLAPGDYYLEAIYTGYETTITQWFSLGNEGVMVPIILIDSTHPLLADFKSGGFVVGSVEEFLDSQYEPVGVSGVEIALSLTSGTVGYITLDSMGEMSVDYSATATTDTGEGRFLIKEVNPGSYDISATKNGYNFPTNSLKVEDGKITFVFISEQNM